MHFPFLRPLGAGLCLVAIACQSERSVTHADADSAMSPPAVVEASMSRSMNATSLSKDAPAPAPMTAMPGAASVPAAQKLIRSGEIRIQLREVASGVRSADSIARSQGGFLADSRVNEGDRGGKDAHLVVRVPSDRFQATVAALRLLGNVQSENISTDDITKSYADLEIRLRVKEETVGRLRALLANRTGKLSEVLDVERELARAVTELEQLKGERQYYDQQVAMSSITAIFTEPGAVRSPGVVEPIKVAFRSALEGLVQSLGAVVYVATFLLPWLVLAALIYLMVRRTRRRRATLATETH